MFGISTFLLARQVTALIRDHRPRAIIHVVPWTAGLVDRFRDIPHVYRPHDYFGMYQWDQRRVQELELNLTSGCRFVSPITNAQVEDFSKTRQAPVRLLPNAVSSEFVQRMRGPAPPRPADLPLGRPIVGCVGQINHSYDIQICASLADAVGEAQFVYIGPIFNERTTIRKQIDDMLARPNVTWLGPKPHNKLPDYLQHFDICLNPLMSIPANHRRSPLRLFDYLASGRPVLSTSVAAASSHLPFVTIGKDSTEMVRCLRDLLSRPTNDDAARRAYVDANTWNVRARQFVTLIDEFCN
jgi:glycosyltransferase involved in cell wall biosynthesis